jgi:hypothetical protein
MPRWDEEGLEKNIKLLQAEVNVWKEHAQKAELELSEAKTLVADWLKHECSVGGPSWEEIESRARAVIQA